MTTARTPLPESQMGPAERLLDLVLGGSAHLWHNRPGLDVRGTWHPAKGSRRPTVGEDQGRHRYAGEARACSCPPRSRSTRGCSTSTSSTRPHGALRELRARRDRLARSQGRVRGAHARAGALPAARAGRRRLGRVLRRRSPRASARRWCCATRRRSTRMLTPKAVLRIAELLEMPEIAALNRARGLRRSCRRSVRRSAAGRRPRSKWLACARRTARCSRASCKAGYKETIKNLSRKRRLQAGSRRQFFGILGWKQKQAADGHRAIGLDNATLAKSERFDGLSRGGDLRDDRDAAASLQGCRRSFARRTSG